MGIDVGVWLATGIVASRVTYMSVIPSPREYNERRSANLLAS